MPESRHTHEPSPLDAGLSEERLAALTGFDNPNVKPPGGGGPRRIDPDTGTSELSADEIEEEITRHTFASHPLVKLAFVSATVLGIVLVAGAFLNALTGGGLWSRKDRPTPHELRQEVAKGDSFDKEKGEILTSLALKEQEDALRKAKERHGAKETPAPVRRVRPAPKRVPPLPTTRYVPPRPTPRIVRFSPPKSAPTIRPTPVAPPPRDPYEEWLLASRMGAYGSIGAGAPGEGRPGSTSGEVAREGDATLVGQRGDVLPIPLSDNTISIGTRATARLDRPLGFTDGETGGPPMRVTFKLSSPLTSATQKEVLATGTQLVAELDTSQAPLVILRPVAFLAQRDGVWTEYPLDPEVLVVTGTGAEPLVAKSKRVNKGGAGRSDLGGALLGALGEAGRVVDIPAADLPGRVYRRLDRNRNETRGSGRATRLYTLGAGVKLELVAVRSFSPFDDAAPAPQSEPPPERTPYVTTPYQAHPYQIQKGQ